jgi:hypothetical protein
MLYGSHAGAEGALAITPLDHFVVGFSAAYVVDAANAAAAAKTALLKCSQSDLAMQSRVSGFVLRDRCKVVKVFRHQCFAIASDETNGRGSGGGWAVEDDLTAAESKALAMCRKNADIERQDLCQVATVSCDVAPATTDQVGELPK